MGQFAAGLVAAVAAVEDAVVAVPATWADADGPTARDLNTRLLRIESRLAAVRLAAVRRLDELDVARTEGATSTAALLAQRHGGDRAGQERFVRTARTLERVGATETEERLAAAEVTASQAEVIGRSLAALPEDATDADRRRAEGVMLEAAGRLRLPDLRRRGERLADTMRSRQDADEAFDRQVERRERSARDRSSLRLWDDPDGVVSHGRFTLPKAESDMLRAVLQGISAPRRQHLRAGAAGNAAGGSGIPLTAEHRDGVAFADLLTRIPTDGLPRHGGAASTVAVMIDLESLTGQVRRLGSLIGAGTPLSAGQVRRIACDAALVPMVLGGESLPLDLGRAQRLFTKAQRLALAVRDGGCTFPDCDKPPAWTEAHHVTPWSRGGGTDLRSAASVCPPHHHLVHDQGWAVRVRADGRVEYRRPGTDRWLINDRYRPHDESAVGPHHDDSPRQPAPDALPGQTARDELFSLPRGDLAAGAAVGRALGCVHRARVMTVRLPDRGGRGTVRRPRTGKPLEKRGPSPAAVTQVATSCREVQPHCAAGRSGCESPEDLSTRHPGRAPPLHQGRRRPGSTSDIE